VPLRAPPARSGPAPTGGSAQCIPDSNRTPVTVGETVFQNKSNGKLLIQKITLHDARNVTLLHTFVTPGDKEGNKQIISAIRRLKDNYQKA
jgi:hypothetical protein